jgi:hypothetical protein
MSEIPSSAATPLAATTSPTSIELSEKEITQFASQFDPQPYHTLTQPQAQRLFSEAYALAAGKSQHSALG